MAKGRRLGGRKASLLRVRLFANGRISDGDDEIKLPSREWTLPLLAFLGPHQRSRCDARFDD
jgi:hypothetical protein